MPTKKLWVSTNRKTPFSRISHSILCYLMRFTKKISTIKRKKYKHKLHSHTSDATMKCDKNHSNWIIKPTPCWANRCHSIVLRLDFGKLEVWSFAIDDGDKLCHNWFWMPKFISQSLWSKAKRWIAVCTVRQFVSRWVWSLIWIWADKFATTWTCTNIERHKCATECIYVPMP